MTEAIVCAIIAGLAAVVVGIINAISQRKAKSELENEIQRQQQSAAEKEAARKEFEIHMIQGIIASNSLGEATARAVQRIPDAHCNGDMDAALEEERRVKKEIQLFLTQQGINNIID